MSGYSGATPIMSAVEKLRMEDCKYEANFGYIASSRLFQAPG